MERIIVPSSERLLQRNIGPRSLLPRACCSPPSRLREIAMSASPTVSPSVLPRSPAADGLFVRMIQAWLGHYQRLIDAGAHPV
jgi:hypothetical protein